MKVSIITVCKNAQDTIEQTIKSVISQTYSNIEYLIIDGESTDKTLDIVRKYKNRIDTVISEPDGGLYYAMNKGIKKSTGDIIYFLNSGDLLFDKGVITKVVKVFKETNADIIYGDMALFNSSNPEKLIIRHQDQVNNSFLVHDTIYHQSIFTKRYIFQKYGKFDTKYKLSADYEWILRSFIKNKISFHYTSQIITKFLRGGLSSNEIQSFKERVKILFQYFSFYQVILNGLLFWLVYRVFVMIKRECFSKG